MAKRLTGSITRQFAQSYGSDLRSVTLGVCGISVGISNGDYYGFYNPSDCPINITLSQLTQIKSMPRNAPKRPRMPINDAANVYHYSHQL
ncbi:hypothetical protein PTI98_012310 [Pleurotus ostreatus]|nr:hypothetical protein PTI98_012310 [Pleurotus ostreatus]